MIEAERVKAKPFVKWAGGKGQLLSQLGEFLPKSFDNYYEPFVGGGAMLFSLETHKAYINDINQVLINTYKELKTNVEDIVDQLRVLEIIYKNLDLRGQQEFFYEKRAEYNLLEVGFKKTVLLIFLNRTCFNGLYRENSQGGFNVPFGKYRNPTICNEDNLRAIAAKLKRTTITSMPYKSATKNAGKGDFIYFDPPYQPLSETSSFTSYHQEGFALKDQMELRDLFVELDKRGCYIMLSNSTSPLIKELFKDFRQETVYAGRNINATASGRGKIPELVVLNY